MPIAITRYLSRAIARCELTHLQPVPIDVALARQQHAAYEQALRSLGFDVRQLPEEPGLPDSVFVEDAAVVLPEIAIITRPGATSRQPETASIARELANLRPIAAIREPGTLDGGDVLLLIGELVVGESSRSNAEGVVQLERIVDPLGYAVRTVPVTGCLHLKTAVTRVGERVLLANPSWIDHHTHFPDWTVVEVDPAEPFAANALYAAGKVILSTSFPKTAERLRHIGISVIPVPASELAKAEGGVTCSSLLIV